MPGGAVAGDSNAVQWILDLVAALVLMMGGGIVKAIRDDGQGLRKDHDELVRSLPETYARRDDVRDGFARIEKQQAEMNAKLDRLIERS